MHFSIITLFPEMFTPVLNSSILGRAQKKGIISFEIVDLRLFGIGEHKTVDDKPYGGGAGMVLRVDVVHSAILEVKKNHPDSLVILMDPKGTPFSQEVAEVLSKEKEIIIICGHYEGFDERIKNFINMEISMGDFVLTGGEIPAMAVIDAVGRLIPGVLGKDESPVNESFSLTEKGRILEHSHYTRPQEYEGLTVPKVLLSGNHAEILNDRKNNALSTTQKKRPDLLKK